MSKLTFSLLPPGICNTLDSGVWEPAANKINSISAATEAACLILSIDETVRNPKSEQAGNMKGKFSSLFLADVCLLPLLTASPCYSLTAG
jgi:hypothetical protein